MTEILVIILIIITVAICVNAVEERKKDNLLDISFKETLDLTDLPIITFYNNNKKLNFILDSGANKSVIDSNIIDNYNYELNSYKGTVTGMEGNPKEVTYCTMNLEHGDLVFEDLFQIVDMSAPFGVIKQETGATIHGILGNEFFKKYKYILDFDELKAVIK